MPPKYYISKFLLFACLFVGFPRPGIAQDCRRGIQRFPCLVYWTTTLTGPRLSVVSGPTIGVAVNGDFIIPTAAEEDSADGPIQYAFDRQLSRVTAAGSEVLTANDPWFTVLDYDVDDIPWQRLAVDAEHNRLFVLYAVHTVNELAGHYSVVLAAHDLQTGEKLASWGGSKPVGETNRLPAGLAIDSTGNPWTVLETSAIGPQTIRWDGQNGNDITPNPNCTTFDNYKAFCIGFDLLSPGDQHFIALGIRKVDNRIYVAFSEAMGSTQSQDLVLTLWDSNLQLLDKKEFFEAVPAPPGLPGVGSDATTYPVFTDGLTSEDGSMSIGGVYVFEGLVGDVQTDFAFPTLFRFGSDPAANTLSVEWTYRETEHYMLNAYDVRLANASGNSTWLIPSSTSFGNVPAFGVTPNGTLATFTYLRNPFGESAVEDPQGSGCYYRSLLTPAAIVASRNGPVISGMREKWLVEGSQTRCLDSGSFDSFVASYYNGMLTVCCGVLRPFEWPHALLLWPHALGMDLHARLFGGALRDEFGKAMTEPRFLGSARRVSKEATQYDILPILHDVRNLVERAGPVESFGGLLQRLAGALEKAPVGHAFDRDLQTAAVGSLRGVHTAEQLTSAVRGKLVEVASALALDRQVLALAGSRGVIAAGGSPAARGVAWMTPRGSAKPGTVLLSARNGIPALAEGFEPAWPLATYHIEFAGEVSEKTPIFLGFKVSEFGFDHSVNAVRVFQWDGKSYRDITEAAEGQKGYAMGRVTGSTDLVLMGVSTSVHPASGK